MQLQPTRPKDSSWLALAGTAFLLLAGFFLWRDLELPREVLLTAAALVAGLATVLRWPRRIPVLAPLALTLTTVAAALWYTLEKGPGLLPPLVIGLVAGLAGVLRAQQEDDRAANAATWYAFGLALLAASWALYFHFFTVGIAADTVARRLIPTLLWLGVGLAFFIGGRGRVMAAVHVGLGFIAVAAGKAAFYDTTHLHGTMRVLVLVAVGALLLFGSRVLGRATPTALPAGKETP